MNDITKEFVASILFTLTTKFVKINFKLIWYRFLIRCLYENLKTRNRIKYCKNRCNLIQILCKQKFWTIHVFWNSGRDAKTINEIKIERFKLVINACCINCIVIIYINFSNRLQWPRIFISHPCEKFKWWWNCSSRAITLF